MIEYVATLKCDKCNAGFVYRRRCKTDLPSWADLKKAYTEEGWQVTGTARENEILCPDCARPAQPDISRKMHPRTFRGRRSRL